MRGSHRRREFSARYESQAHLVSITHSPTSASAPIVENRTAPLHSHFRNMTINTLETTTESDRHAGVVNVTVRYAAASRPFHDHAAQRSETLLSLMARVLTAFGLSDGAATGDGSTIAYLLYDHRSKLTDLSATLGSVAGHHDAVELKLSQHVQQGSVAVVCGSST